MSRRERHRQHRRQLAILRGMRSDNVLVGPRVYLTGSSIEAGVFIARPQTARVIFAFQPSDSLDRDMFNKAFAEIKCEMGL